MKSFTTFLQPARAFLISWALLLIMFAWVYYDFPKGKLELQWNGQHSLFADYFFSYTTHLGNGWTYAVFVIVLLFIDRRKFFIALCASLLVAITVGVLKNYIFPNEPRPLSFFANDVVVHLPEGAHRLLYGSFPSGHTMSAFSMFFLIAYFFANRYMQNILFTLAILVGISRMYLLAHFKEDVWTGALLGVIISLSVLAVFEYFSPMKIDSSSRKINHPVIRIRRNEKKN